MHGHESREVPPGQYTVEGQIHMVGEFASGLRRARGWRRTVAWLVVLLVLFSLLVGALTAGAPS